jgi:hypothetical protein
VLLLHVRELLAHQLAHLERQLLRGGAQRGHLRLQPQPLEAQRRTARAEARLPSDRKVQEEEGGQEEQQEEEDEKEDEEQGAMHDDGERKKRSKLGWRRRRRRQLTTRVVA